MALVDIFITELTDAKRTMRIPWLPSEFSFEANGTRMATYDIMDAGEVKLPNGENIGSFSWPSVLPGEGHQDLPFLRGEWKDPHQYQGIWSAWRVYGTPLRLIMTGTPINHDVYLEDYNVKYTGAFGDYKYDIKFCHKRHTEIQVVAPAEEPPEPQKRPETVSSAKTHTVVSGDDLWSIAQRYLGSGIKWQEIYSENRAVIEDAAKAMGRAGSDNGHWIYPGTVLKIPGG